MPIDHTALAALEAHQLHHHPMLRILATTSSSAATAVHVHRCACVRSIRTRLRGVAQVEPVGEHLRAGEEHLPYTV